MYCSWHVVVLVVLHAAQGLNPCIDVATELVVCNPATNQILYKCHEFIKFDTISGHMTYFDNMVLFAKRNDTWIVSKRSHRANARVYVTARRSRREVHAGPTAVLMIPHDKRVYTDEGVPVPFNVGDEGRSLSTKEDEPVAFTFFELATERFESRIAASATAEEEDATLEHLQLIRVPKAGSSEASVIARILAGCNPRGPCCFKHGRTGTCPPNLENCRQVVGCNGHKMRGKENRALEDPSLFSMSHLRDIVDRLVSGFFYGSGHSPDCAKEKIVEYEECFEEMTTLPRYQNVASRMFSGHYAYDGDVLVCMQEDSQKDCAETLASVMAGTCNLNLIMLTELWQTSILLLFETLPWVQPTLDFFPIVQSDPEVESPNTPDEGPSLETEEYLISRRNTDDKHEEGMKHITPEMRDAARQASPVDNALHEFVSAKFCDRLQETGLLQHPLVVEELGTFELLHERCMDGNWTTTTLERFQRMVPEDCRLYQPFTLP